MGIVGYKIEMPIPKVALEWAKYGLKENKRSYVLMCNYHNTKPAYYILEAIY